jgi:branched-chain amino acid transport system substrate-binding protein
MLTSLTTAATAAQAREPSIALVLDRQTQKTVWIEVAQGAQLAADEIKAAGKRLRFTPVDSGTSAVGTRTEMINLMKDPPDVVVAEIDSSKAAVAAEIAEANHRVMITPFATAPRVTEGKSYVFRACVPDNIIAERLARYALSTRKARRVAIVYDAGTLYSVALRDAFKKAFIAGGGEVVLDSSMLSTMNSYDSLAASVVAAKPDLVFLPFYEETVGRFLIQAVKIPGFPSLELLGGDGWAGGAFFGKDAAAPISALKGTWVTHHDPNLTQPAARSFAARFKRRFGRGPETSAAFLGYDAVRLSYETLARLPAKATPEMIRDAFHRRAPYHGVTGEISFNHGNEPNKALFLIRHEQGRIRTIGNLP